MATIALRGDVLQRALERKAPTNVDKGRLLGLNNGTISRVFTGRAHPGNRFIAAVLRNVPMPFDELFVVVDDDVNPDAAAEIPTSEAA